jgi:hypothetical protein
MFARVKKSRQGDYLRIEVLHEDGLGRHDLQRQRGPGGGQKDEPVRRCVRRFDGLRGHRHLPIEDGAAGSDPRRAEA